MSGSASVSNTFASAVTATGLQLDQNFTSLVNYANDPANRNNYAADTGSTNTVVLTFSPPITVYTAGLEITFKVANTNTGATKLNANTVSAAPLVQPGGTDLASGQIEAGGIYKAAYNGSQWVYIGQNVLAASKTDMQTATSAITFVSPAQTQNHPGVAKAWGTFNGTGVVALISGYNVAGIGDGGTGTYTVTLTTPMTSTEYAIVITPLSTGAAGTNTGNVQSQATNAFTITTAQGGTVVDFPRVFFAVYGTQ